MLTATRNILYYILGRLWLRKESELSFDGWTIFSEEKKNLIRNSYWSPRNSYSFILDGICGFFFFFNMAHRVRGYKWFRWDPLSILRIQPILSFTGITIGSTRSTRCRGRFVLAWPIFCLYIYSRRTFFLNSFWFFHGFYPTQISFLFNNLIGYCVLPFGCWWFLSK